MKQVYNFIEIMKKYLNKISYLMILISLSLPSFVQALWTGGDLVPCKPKLNADGTGFTDACTFNSLITGVSNIIDLGLYLAASIAAVMFSYAGFLYLSAQGDPGKIKSAHDIFRNVVYGLFFALGAWLIVKAVLIGLGAESSSFLNL